MDARTGNSTESALLSETDRFMQRHWSFDGAPALPQWSDPWHFRESMPFNDRQGCYALLSGEEVIYLGVGAGSRNPKYPGHGLGGRIGHCFNRVKRGALISGVGAMYEPKGHWKERGLDSIRTIGIESDFAYLAYALEAFLIFRLKPQFNRQRPGAPKLTPRT